MLSVLLFAELRIVSPCNLFNDEARSHLNNDCPAQRLATAHDVCGADLTFPAVLPSAGRATEVYAYIGIHMLDISFIPGVVMQAAEDT